MTDNADFLTPLSYFERSKVRKLGQSLFAMSRQKRLDILKSLTPLPEGRDAFWHRRTVASTPQIFDICAENNIRDCRVLEWLIEGDLKKLKEHFSGTLIPLDHALTQFVGVRSKTTGKGLSFVSCLNNDATQRQFAYVFHPLKTLAFRRY